MKKANVLGWVVLGIGLLLAVHTGFLLGYVSQKAAVERLKADVREIEAKSSALSGQIRRFSARTWKGGSWDWREYKSEEEAQLFFQGYFNFRAADVYSKDGRVFCVAYDEWSDSGDWYQHVDYYFDDAERIICIEFDFRTFIGNVKVIQSEYFDSEGKSLGTTVTYYRLKTGEIYSKKPKYLPDIPVPIFLKVSDLPFYPLLRQPAGKGPSQ